MNTGSAAMGPSFCVFVSLCLLQLSAGVDLTFNQDVPAVPGGRKICGVVTCEEEIIDSNQTHGGPAYPFSSISTLSLFKILSHVLSSHDKSKQEILIASVTTQEPSVTRVANSMKVYGSLDARRATIRVELVKSGDCQSLYSCRVQGVDNQGREAVNTASLVHQPGQKTNQVNDGPLMSAVPLQLLTSMQQLVTLTVAGLETKIDSIEQRLADDIKSVDNNLEDKISLLQRDLSDRSTSLERQILDRLLQLENRVEDKIENNNYLNKLIQLDVKVSTQLAQFRSAAKADISNTLDSMKQEMQGANQETLNNLNGKVEEFLSNSSISLFSMESDLNHIKTRGKAEVLAIKNQTEMILEMISSGKNVSNTIWEKVMASNSEILSNMRALESNIHNCTLETKTRLPKLSNDLESGTTNVTVLKSCTKRSASTQTSNSAAYTVINSGEDGSHTFGFPYLCESVTDGGGWVVIQRRSTGNIDFNRGWSDYRLGFGSFYDDFWLGNEKIHAITRDGVYELDVKLRFQDKEVYARYSNFSIEDEKHNYKLTIGDFSGTAGDSLRLDNGEQFTTADRDNDKDQENCAAVKGGGWWFKDCGTVESFLTK
ncbi:hypothetical protein RRG08_039218 [Elysia crispata]|uniref:Fibrinogen C-terminal domain-containing protein n=1 Tax=Elysia crispata TaxID=231223 RepID=A0AAE1AT81_9GAST|nr:hypothetical protein RRG08_039218 [Elysia crispata]